MTPPDRNKPSIPIGRRWFITASAAIAFCGSTSGRAFPVLAEPAAQSTEGMEEGNNSHDPTYNIEAEQALLAAILVNNVAYERVSTFLLPEHFAESVHGRIFAAIANLIEHGRNANPAALKNLFDEDGALREVGGGEYLARLARSVVTIINAEDYGRTIHALHKYRTAMEPVPKRSIGFQGCNAG